MTGTKKSAMVQWRRSEFGHPIEPEKIDGIVVVETFAILHAGWESDYEGWVTADDRVWTTSEHLGVYEMGAAEMAKVIERTEESLNGLLRAQAKMERRSAVSREGSEPQGRG